MLRIIFYSWLAVSLAIYGYRLVRWLGRRGDRPDADVTTGDATGGTRVPDDVVRAAGSQMTIEPPRIDRAAERTSRRARRQAQIDAMKADAEGPMPTEELFREAAAQQMSAAADADQGVARTLRPLAEAPAMATLLAGLDWPCDLAPHVVEGWDPYYRIALTTTAADAATVRRAMGEGLEALGYELHDQGPRVIADGDRGRVAMTVHDSASKAADVHDLSAFGVLPRGAVVVELGSRW